MGALVVRQCMAPRHNEGCVGGTGDGGREEGCTGYYYNYTQEPQAPPSGITQCPQSCVWSVISAAARDAYAAVMCRQRCSLASASVVPALHRNVTITIMRGGKKKGKKHF